MSLRQATRIAVCGLGNIGLVHLRNLLSLRGFQVCGVYDLRPEARNSVAGVNRVRSYASPDALLGDPDCDAVVIATPASSHRELCIEALKHKKHVFLEKPLAGTLADAEAIVAAVKATDRIVQIGFCERFNAQFIEAKRAVAGSSVGAVRAIYTSRIAPYALSDPAWDLGVLDTAVHNFDLILWLLGRSPETVQTHGIRIWEDSDIPHTANTTMTFSGGVVANDQITWLRDEAHPLHECARARMLILGTAGSFEVDLSARPSTLLTAGSYRMIDTVLIGSPEYYSCLRLQFESLLRAIEDGSKIEAPAEDALAVERVAMAAFESLRTGKQVML